MQTTQSTIRSDVSVSEAGDRISAGQQLIYAGGKERNGQIIKRGIDLL